jgi:zinc transport system permease protein
MSLWYHLVEKLPFSWVEFDFMKNALLAVLLVSGLFAHLGTMIVNRQMAFFSEAIGHAALTGIAIGVVLGCSDPLWVMLVFAVIIAFGISWLRRMSQASVDTIIGLFMAFTVALGVMLLSRGGEFNKYSRYLIGNILSITPTEIARLLIIISITIIFWTLFYNKLFLASLNASLAKSRVINVWLMESLFSALVAVVVTISIQWVGLLVINSFLILPASTARNIARNTFEYTWIAMAVSVLSGIMGLLASYYWGTATGATIVIFALGFFLLSLVMKIRFTH